MLKLEKTRDIILFILYKFQFKDLFFQLFFTLQNWKKKKIEDQIHQWLELKNMRKEKIEKLPFIKSDQRSWAGCDFGLN